MKYNFLFSYKKTNGQIVSDIIKNKTVFEMFQIVGTVKALLCLYESDILKLEIVQ